MTKYNGIKAAAKETKRLNGYNGIVQIDYNFIDDTVSASYYVDRNSYHEVDQADTVAVFTREPLTMAEIKEKINAKMHNHSPELIHATLEYTEDKEIYRLWNLYCEEDDKENPVYANTDENVQEICGQTPEEVEREYPNYYFTGNNWFFSNDFITKSFDDLQDSPVVLNTLANWLSKKSLKEWHDIGFKG